MARVRFLVDRAGERFVDFAGSERDLPEAEATALCRSGQAEPMPRVGDALTATAAAEQTAALAIPAAATPAARKQRRGAGWTRAKKSGS